LARFLAGGFAVGLTLSGVMVTPKALAPTMDDLPVRHGVLDLPAGENSVIIGLDNL
jgi:hypothetical protein